MRREGQLFEKLTDFHALLAAARRAARGKRKKAEVAAFRFDLEGEVLRLKRELEEGRWRPGPYRTFCITDPKPRLISAAPFRDRVVHHAICAAIEPRLERYAIADSFACRPKKGTRAAVLRAQAFARRHPRYLKLDIRHFFETADHGVLKALLRRLFEDGRLCRLLETVIDAGAPGSPPGKGLPIGNLTSQHFANLYLGRLDHFIKETLRVQGYVRYMDDMLLFAPNRAHQRRWHQAAAAFAADALHLELKEEATRYGLVADGVPFLGFRLWPRLIRLDAPRAHRLRRRLRDLDRGRRSGRLTEDAVRRSMESLYGWAAQANTRRFLASFVDRLGAAEGA